MRTNDVAALTLAACWLLSSACGPAPPEPEKTKVEIQQEDDEPEDDPPFELDFGDLPPLN